MLSVVEVVENLFWKKILNFVTIKTSTKTSTTSCSHCSVFFHPDLMVSRAKIQFGEIPVSMKLIYDKDRECILDGNIIKFSKIRTHPPITFFI